MSRARHRPSGGHRALRALGAGTALAAAAHAGPALSARGRWRERVLPGLLGVGAPDGVALTFDDGPHPQGTPAVLEALAAQRWRATFFLLGQQVEAHPRVAAAVVAAGHEVAVHGWDHRNELGRTGWGLARDLRRARDAVRAATGADPALFRPPYGVLSGPSLLAVRAARLRPVLWTAWGRDWEGGPADAAAALVLRDLRAGGTVLLHDSDATSAPGSWRTAAAVVPLLAPAVAAHGWAVRPLGEHLALGAGSRAATAGGGAR